MGNLHLVGTDVLGDPPGFAGGDAGFADRIEQAGFAMVDVAHHGHHRWATDQVGEVAFLDHLHRLLGGFLNVVFQHRDAEFLGHGFDRGEVKGLGHRGDDTLEEEALDDLGALDAELVGELLHREVALRHHKHFRPDLLGFAGSAELHGPAALALAGGFLFALAHGRHRLGGWGPGGAGLGRPGQAGLQHHGFLLTGVATGFGCQRIIVFANDVHLGALLLRRPAAQGLQLGGVVPIGTAGTACGSGSRGRTESGAAGGGWWCGGRPHQIWRSCAAPGGSSSCFGALTGAPGWWGNGATGSGFLQLHELPRSHGLAHARGHPRTTRGGRTVATGASWTSAIAANGFADQFQGAGGGTARDCWAGATGLAWANRGGRAGALGLGRALAQGGAAGRRCGTAAGARRCAADGTADQLGLARGWAARQFGFTAWSGSR